MERVNWQRTRDILISLICVGLLIWATWSLSGLFVHAIVLLLLAMAVAFLVSPAVNFLESYHVPRILATFLVYALTLAALGALGYALIFSLIKQVQAFSFTIQDYAARLPDLASTQKTLRDLGIPQDSIDNAIRQVENQATSFATSTVNGILNIVITLSDVIINILLVTVISFYLTLDGKGIRNKIFGILPRPSQPHFLLFEDSLNRVVGNYIRGQLTLAAIIGLLAGLGCASPWLGLKDYALIIGALAFIFETIPMVGPALASIPAIAISLLLPDPFPRTYWVLAYFVFIQLFESNVLGPRIVGHAVGLHPVASILALIVGAQLFGPFGALLATPVVAALWVVIASLYRSVFRGESAEEILMNNKRTPWVVRKPRVEPVKSAGRPFDGGGGRQNEKSRGLFGTVPTVRKSIDMDEKIEQLDLLRPVAGPQEQRPSMIGEEEE